MPLSRLTLTDFRSYRSATLELQAGFVLLFGENGAGKTNLLEAVSMLTPGRGLRGAALSEMARRDGVGTWAVAAHAGGAEIGTGTLPISPERRQVRINGANAAVNSLSEWVAVLWLTPAMDRLFSGSPGERRRFLDRLVLALEPTHAHHSSRYDAAMRERNRLLADDRWDDDWLSSLEGAMAEHGTEIANARERTVAALDLQLAQSHPDEFASAEISLIGWEQRDIAKMLRERRKRDAAARRTLEGPQRQDLAVLHRSKQLAAAQSSTGEQKALLLGLVLAHADLVATRRCEAPILLLDEVAAHLDPKRRAALFRRLDGRAQVWMTATELALFDGIETGTRIHVEDGVAKQR